jgi:hypothetical protein
MKIKQRKKFSSRKRFISPNIYYKNKYKKYLPILRFPPEIIIHGILPNLNTVDCTMLACTCKYMWELLYNFRMFTPEHLFYTIDTKNSKSRRYIEKYVPYYFDFNSHLRDIHYLNLPNITADNIIYNRAIRYGSVTVLQFLDSILIPRCKDVMHVAICFSNANVLDYLYNNGIWLIRHNLMTLAITHDNREAIDWLIMNNCPISLDDLYNLYNGI